jgi:flagellar biogenesis protein FliO
MLEEIVKSTIFIILLALGGYFFVLFRRKGWFFPQMVNSDRVDSDRLQITGRLSLGGRHYIAVVRCNGQKFLVGVSSNSLTSLGELRPLRRGEHVSVRDDNFTRSSRNNRSINNRNISEPEVSYPR